MKLIAVIILILLLMVTWSCAPGLNAEAAPETTATATATELPEVTPTATAESPSDVSIGFFFTAECFPAHVQIGIYDGDVRVADHVQDYHTNIIFNQGDDFTFTKVFRVVYEAGYDVLNLDFNIVDPSDWAHVAIYPDMINIQPGGEDNIELEITPYPDTAVGIKSPICLSLTAVDMP